MPHRPKKKVPLGKRPSWNVEPDYYLRERRRLQLVQAIGQDAGNMRELPDECPGCDQRIWEARKGDTIFRGCHCHTLMLPPGHRLYQFDAKAWADAVRTSGQALQLSNPLPDKGRACIRALARIHPSLRTDPFAVIKGALAGSPGSLGFDCTSCQQPVRRGFTPAQLTGFEFSLIACGCTGLNRFAKLGDPTAEQWKKIVAEAARLAPGQLKVHTQVIDELLEAGGTN